MIGREKEIKILEDAYKDDKSHFIAIYGRRRIGKTYTVRETFHDRFTFTHAGISDGGLKEQLLAFKGSLKEAGYIVSSPLHNWIEAFEELKDLIRKSTEKKKLIFIDELSWMDTPKSGLITALENFWNGWASARKDIVLIVCASATSWMLSNVVHNKGGLYNRLTDIIHLHSFTLSECENYVETEGIAFNRTQILQYYMIFGGVPYYWTFLRRGESLAQNVDRTLFAEDAPLKHEFDYLYASVFKNPAKYIKIIEALGKKKVGMTREELIKTTGLTNSGDLTTRLDELESCGFIRKYQAFGMKKKNSVYQLIDFFTLFYYKFIVDEPTDEHFWSNKINTPEANVWNGLAFERVCFRHIDKIKEKLGILGVQTDINSWYCQEDTDRGLHGSQIDLLIARRDQVINLCEIKYSMSEYVITERFDRDMRIKINDLVTASGTKYAVYPTLITTYGVVENSYSGSIQSVVTLNDMF